MQEVQEVEEEPPLSHTHTRTHTHTYTHTHTHTHTTGVRMGETRASATKQYKKLGPSGVCVWVCVVWVCGLLV